MGNKMGTCLSSELSQKDLEALAEQTHFNTDQVKTFYTEFLEEFPEGKITKDVFISKYKGLCTHGNAESFAENVFRAYDEDESGCINFVEYLVTVNITTHGNLADRLEWAFKLYDKNNDGFIDREELNKFILSVYRLKGTVEPEKQAAYTSAELFLSLDKNRDHLISLQDFIDGAEKTHLIQKLLSVSAPVSATIT